jgi:hypothetical protein
MLIIFQAFKLKIALLFAPLIKIIITHLKKYLTSIILIILEFILIYIIFEIHLHLTYK